MCKSIFFSISLKNSILTYTRFLFPSESFTNFEFCENGVMIRTYVFSDRERTDRNVGRMVQPVGL
ncbi:hypothetical protein LEP1GSC188_4085 [Leptospira weilii serovar Topaz str. LT2116]|uniref:Uncharacterized protein n=1 Tax=Leptospira weilii serovar Topaz str. LT2116 TaxID=1088540 RepID=M3H639_9LEPT|nr:hypothetical protein LEP1GSC188_4085 [Leptospira weilii serovar Topaz str. LT2116]